jgi:hypothetical protein
MSDGVAFVDITAGGAPRPAAFLPAASSAMAIWADVKVYGNYAYIVGDAPGRGLQVYTYIRFCQKVMSLHSGLQELCLHRRRRTEEGPADMYRRFCQEVMSLHSGLQELCLHYHRRTRERPAGIYRMMMIISRLVNLGCRRPLQKCEIYTHQSGVFSHYPLSLRIWDILSMSRKPPL